MTRNQCRKYGSKVVLVGSGLGLTFLASSAFADITGITSAITAAATDVGTIGSAILVVIVAIAAFAWLRKPMH